MGIEIERKFIVPSLPVGEGDTHSDIAQGYFGRTGAANVRVRVLDGSGYLTIKSAEASLKRYEYEYSIPVEDARDMLARFCSDRLIIKRRYSVVVDDLMWTVDVFSGRLSGLVLAEVELAEAEQVPTLPKWVGREVTNDERFLNSRLASITNNEFRTWRIT